MQILTEIRRDLRLQILALYLMLVVPILIFILAFDQITGVRIQAEARASDLTLAHTIATDANVTIQNALATVAQLGRYPAVITSSSSGMRSLFSVVHQTRPDINLIYRLNAEGGLVYHYPTASEGVQDEDLFYREFILGSLYSTSPLLSPGRISPNTRQPVVSAVMPIWKGDIFNGLVAANFTLESLNQTIDNINAERSLSQSFQVYLIDSSSRIIAHPDPNALLTDAALLFGNVYVPALKGQAGTTIAMSQQGQEILYAYAPVPGSRWAVLVARPTSSAFAAQRTFHRVTLTAIGALVLIGLLFWRIISNRIVRPIEKLADIGETLGTDLFITETERRNKEDLLNRPDQIGHLARSTNRLEQTLSSRFNEQTTLLETSKVVASSLDLKLVLPRILEQVMRLMNVEKTAIIALDERKGVFRVRASFGLSKNYTEKVSIQPSEQQSVTMRTINAKQPIQISDIETDPAFAHHRPVAREEGYRSVLSIPLLTKHAPPAALLVFRPDAHIFSRDEKQLLVSFANHAAMAIENAALYARSDTRLQEQTRRLESLIQSYNNGLILTDLRGSIAYANRRIGDLVELNQSELVGTPLRQILPRLAQKTPNGTETLNSIEAALKKTGDTEFNMLYNGRTMDLRLQVFDVTDPNGIHLGQGLIFQDITADRELDNMKSSLIATVSHELRTPLAAIKGYATTLLAEDVEWDRSSQQEFLTIISDEADRMSTLVNDLLDLSRIEAGNLPLRITSINIEQVIRNAVARTNISPNNKFSLKIKSVLPEFHADQARLEVILRNLIENAVKYGGENAEIKVRVGHQSNKIVFRVEDNGPGIPAEKSNRVFESFYRAEEGLTPSVGGAGLGLAICQGFVRAHGGEIWVEPLETGTGFAFSIPLNLDTTLPQEEL